MNAIKMQRLQLLEIVQNNKVKHVDAFIEAVSDYKMLVLQIAEDNVKLARSASLDSFKKMKSMPATPVSYEDSYKRAIRMLELSVDDIIEIEEDVFNQLVLDEWSWKRGFEMAGAMYKSAM